jgi:hypothetical protein
MGKNRVIKRLTWGVQSIFLAKIGNAARITALLRSLSPRPAIADLTIRPHSLSPEYAFVLFQTAYARHAACHTTRHNTHHQDLNGLCDAFSTC